MGKGFETKGRSAGEEMHTRQEVRALAREAEKGTTPSEEEALYPTM